LVRGVNGESTASTQFRVNDQNRYRFDQSCRLKAAKDPAQPGIQELLPINFLPKAVYEPKVCIRSTFDVARQNNFPIERSIFEVLEDENVSDRPHLTKIFEEYIHFGSSKPQLMILARVTLA
jgi:EAL domain-containing protein (putative c-di-GMP-specific phosphodiesterase class I)